MGLGEILAKGVGLDSKDEVVGAHLRGSIPCYLDFLRSDEIKLYNSLSLGYSALRSQMLDLGHSLRRILAMQRNATTN